MDWKTLRLRPKTRELLEYIAGAPHHPYINAIYLFGSEVRGEANLLSDVDLAIVASRPLTVPEKQTIFINVPYELICDIDIRTVGLTIESLETANILEVGHSVKREGVLVYGNIL